MTSLRQIEANRRNARLSAGPTTEEGRRKSRRNAVCHRLTAETVIDALEDAADYAAFEVAVTSAPLSKENSFFDWQACYGDCDEPPRSRAACSKFRRSTCYNSGGNDRPIKSARRLSTICINSPSPLGKMSDSMKTNPPCVSIVTYP